MSKTDKQRLVEGFLAQKDIDLDAWLLDPAMSDNRVCLEIYRLTEEETTVVTIASWRRRVEAERDA